MQLAWKIKRLKQSGEWQATLFTPLGPPLMWELATRWILMITSNYLLSARYVSNDFLATDMGVPVMWKHFKVPVRLSLPGVTTVQWLEHRAGFNKVVGLISAWKTEKIFGSLSEYFDVFVIFVVNRAALTQWPSLQRYDISCSSWCLDAILCFGTIALVVCFISWSFSSSQQKEIKALSTEIIIPVCKQNHKGI